MAQGLEFIQNEATIKTFGTEFVQPAERWSWEITANGITFSLVFAPIPPPQGGPSIWTAELIDEQAAEWRDLLTALNNHAGVSGIWQAQELNDANQLIDYIYISVRSRSGLSVRTIKGRMADVLPPSPLGDEIDAIRAELNAAEAGS